MKIGIDISPLQTGHKVRGVGFYVEHLRNALTTYCPKNEYVFFVNKPDDSLDLVHYPYFDLFHKFDRVTKDTKLLITIHDLTPLIMKQEFPVGIRGMINWQRNKHFLKSIDGVITDSENAKRDIVRLVGIPEKKVHVVYLAAGEQFKKLETGKWEVETRKKYKLPDRFALYVGDVTVNKNLPRLVEAVKKTDIPLVMVGKALINTDFDRSHPWNKDLVSVKQMIQNSAQFILPGFVPTSDLVALYNMASVFIMPSLSEGFGLPVLEAMQCGCPVVTSDLGSLKEIVEDAGLLVDPLDTNDIALGIKQIWDDSDLQKKYSELGFRQAAKFSWQRTAEETVAVYESVLSGKI